MYQAAPGEGWPFCSGHVRLGMTGLSGTLSVTLARLDRSQTVLYLTGWQLYSVSAHRLIKTVLASSLHTSPARHCQWACG